MIRNSTLIILAVLLIPAMIFADSETAKVKIENLPVGDGSEEINAPIAYPPYPDSFLDNTDDMVGDTV
ncbi:hypothetical protein KKA08_03675, partial [bacterium]|nr:hypothetical protein [bacterium]